MVNPNTQDSPLTTDSAFSKQKVQFLQLKDQGS